MLTVNPGRAQRGFSLIEVLITLVVLSIGLLGTAAMQMVSKKSTYDSVQRTTAAWAASAILERMRANNTVLDQYLGATIATALPPAAVDCDAGNCGPGQLAAFDQWRTVTSLNGASESGPDGAVGGLVDATLCVAGPADGASGTYEVAIAWRGASGIDNSLVHPCGAGRYGDTDQFRRLLVYSTYLDAG